MSEQQVKGSWGVRFLSWTFILFIAAGVCAFGLVLLISSMHHSRFDPAFRGFRGNWLLEPAGNAKDTWGRLDIGPEDQWSLTEWSQAQGESTTKGTWQELPDGIYELKSSSRVRTAKFEEGDEWVLYIDGLKFRRIVK